jgi:hypothetical protein
VAVDGVTLEVEAVEGLAVQTVLVRLPAMDKTHES